jgi:hypothetical protein
MSRHFEEDFGMRCPVARFYNVYGPYGTWSGGREKAPALYLAPMYGDCIEEEALLSKIRDRRPANIIVAIGGATQERLGLYLKNNLSGPGHSLPRSGDCFPQRRSGPHSRLGRARQRGYGSKPKTATLLGVPT